MKSFYLFLIFALYSVGSVAQDQLIDELLDESKPKKQPVLATFKTTRVITAHSVETVKKNALDFRISHRFGDVAAPGTRGHTLFGFDVAADILLSFEYGILDDLTVGIGRAKGAGPVRELYNGFIKYRVLKQTTDFKIPLTLTLFANASVSSMKKQSDMMLISSFPKWDNRISYTAQALIACKATDWLSLQLSPTFIWRNIVPYNDQNGLFFMGLSGRARMSRRSAITFEYFLPITRKNATYREYFPMLRGLKDAQYYHHLGLGVEFETGGHIFHINLTNSQGLLENDFLPYTSSNWLQGGFRLGFTISRSFQFGKGMNAWTGRHKKGVAKGKAEESKKSE